MKDSHPLQLAVEELQKMPTIDIKGKSYTQVSTRLAVFRKYFPDAEISTVLVHDDTQRVVIQAKIKIGDSVVSTGFAEEFRGDGWINATSALENAETSSIGRALAGLSLSGNEFASANEVSNAISQQHHLQNNNKLNNAGDRTSASSPDNAQLYQNTNVEQRVHELGLGIEQLSDGSLAVTGNSFPFVSELKKLKCRWQPQLKQWVLPQNTQSASAA